MKTSLKNYPKVLRVIHSLTRVSNKIVKISLDYMFKIVECEGHSRLEGCSGVFKDERHLLVCESTPRTNKFHLVLILVFNLNLVIT
jgi:hypothetical protein